jgi:phospholipase/lecithinase/hemolysin
MALRPLIVAAFALSLSVLPASASYTALYSFGDSLSDVGNVYSITGLPVVPPYYGGRFSNGLNWVDDLSLKLGSGPVIPSAAGGNDYAWGGATTGYPGTLYPVFPFPIPTLQDQLGQFLGSPGSAPSGALYTFSIGANDLFGVLSDPALTLPEILADVQGAAEAVASAAAALAGAGARDLLLFDVPNLGLTPEITEAGVPGLPDFASQLSQQFNAYVLADISTAAPGLTVFDINAYDLLTEAVADPGKFGFTNVTDPCWSGDVFGGGTVCSPDRTVQDQNLFWDHEHPTEAGHRVIADAALQVLGVPESSTWTMILLGFTGLGFVAHRVCKATPATA